VVRRSSPDSGATSKQQGGLIVLAALLLLVAPQAAAGDAGRPLLADTAITAAPPALVTNRRARLAFTASHSDARFECRINEGVFTACRSPVVYRKLEPGPYRFEVRAVSLSGLADVIPAQASWRVERTFKLSAGSVSRWAPVLGRVVARAYPLASSPVLARLRPRTPEGTTNLVLALERLEDPSGRLWIRVQLPVLPNNSTGWVPRSALGGYTAVGTRLVVHRRALRATLYRHGQQVWRARIGIGERRWPTPAGEFYVRVKLLGFSDPFYGPVAFGTSARTDVLTDWPGGGFVGIHGTDAPWLLPGRVSHGCIRLRNEDILRLERLMPVGTPLTIL